MANTIIKQIKQYYLILLLVDIMFLLLGIWVCLATYGTGKAAQKSYESFVSLQQEYLDVIDGYETINSDNVQALNAYQAYCDNAIAMKINAQNSPCLVLQYSISDTAIGTSYYDSITNFIKSGVLGDHLYDVLNLPELQLYLHETSYTAFDGSSYSIQIFHYDENVLTQISSVIDQILQDYVAELRTQYADAGMKWTLTANSLSMSINNELMNHQINVLNYLASLQSACALSEQTLLQNRTNYDTWVSTNMPTVIGTATLVRKVFLYALYGLIVGIVVGIGVLIVIYCLGVPIESASQISKTGCAVLLEPSQLTNAYEKQPQIKSDAEKSDPSTALSMSDAFISLSLAIEKSKSQSLCLVSPALYDSMPKYQELLVALSFAFPNLSIMTADVQKDDPLSIRHILGADHCILILSLHDNSMNDYRNMHRLCHELHTPVLGCILC